MKRLLPILFLFALSGCYGTFHVDQGEPDDAASVVATQSPADTPADTATPAPTTTQPTAPATSTPTPEPEPEPEPPVDEPPAEEPEPEEEPLPEPGSVVEFQIPQGTGTGAWNTADNPVTVYVGQFLKITNLDDRNHRMHAAQGAAVPHGGDLVPGQSEEYLVDSAMSVGAEAMLWDHNDGRNAPFWVEAIPYPAP